MRTWKQHQIPKCDWFSRKRQKKNEENKWTNLNCNNSSKFPLSLFTILPCIYFNLRHRHRIRNVPCCCSKIRQKMHLFAFSRLYLRWFFLSSLCCINISPYTSRMHREMNNMQFCVFAVAENRAKEKGYLCFTRLLCIFTSYFLLLWLLSRLENEPTANTLQSSRPHLHCVNAWPCRFCLHSLCVCVWLCRAIIQGEKNEKKI